MGMYDFAIVCHPRSGSHMLASMLDSHPDIRCEGEYFRKKGPDPQTVNASEGRIKGCILHYRYFKEWPQVGKRIHLLRDPRSVAISRARFQYRKDHGLDFKGHYRDRSYIGANKQIPIDWDIFSLCYASALKYQLKFFERLKGKSLHVWYEEITDRDHTDEMPEEIGKRICKYIGVEYAPMRSVYVKGG